MTEETKVQTLKVARKTFTMLSEHRTQILDITKSIRDVMLSADIKEGILLVNSLHTTCALFVNEFQGALVEDLKSMIESLVAENDGYRHDDPRYSDCERGNAHSHLRAARPPPRYRFPPLSSRGPNLRVVPSVIDSFYVVEAQEESSGPRRG
jgi:secondary thiamine-phosphate synthase enzyme